ncbi:hypothetical protein EVA_13232 [gut metagenome]|uniref:Uncharacterized protein n=1 Tax=gut metagenome TaxID=749906 RepID=J9GGZ0_9ZZZZ
MRSASFTSSSNFISSRMVSVPERKRAFKKPAIPAPAPPAAPAPGIVLSFGPLADWKI